MNTPMLKRMLAVGAVLASVTAFGPVARAADDASSNAAIAANVKKALAADYRLKGAGIHVRVVEGVAVLTGTVANGVIVDQAGDAASRVAGVEEVSNELKVRGSGS